MSDVFQKTGTEMITEIAAEVVNLDDFFRRDPATFTDDDILAVINLERIDRARFMLAEQARKDKKAGIAPVDGAEEDEGE